MDVAWGRVTRPGSQVLGGTGVGGAYGGGQRGERQNPEEDGAGALVAPGGQEVAALGGEYLQLSADPLGGALELQAAGVELREVAVEVQVPALHGRHPRAQQAPGGVLVGARREFTGQRPAGARMVVGGLGRF
ncbi:hypothetical protein AAGT00_00135 (plasmid) [Streptomyces cavourensis]